jgi:hypothetical protein
MCETALMGNCDSCEEVKVLFYFAKQDNYLCSRCKTGDDK